MSQKLETAVLQSSWFVSRKSRLIWYMIGYDEWFAPAAENWQVRCQFNLAHFIRCAVINFRLSSFRSACRCFCVSLSFFFNPENFSSRSRTRRPMIFVSVLVLVTKAWLLASLEPETASTRADQRLKHTVRYRAVHAFERPSIDRLPDPSVYLKQASTTTRQCVELQLALYDVIARPLSHHWRLVAWPVWLSGVVVNALGIRARCPGVAAHSYLILSLLKFAFWLSRFLGGRL